MIPGEYFLRKENIKCNVGRPLVSIHVVNTGDRPIQVGSHFHFFEINKQVLFNRDMAFGMRLNIPAGTAVRLEPGEEKEVELVSFGGNQVVHGFNNLVNGAISDQSIKNGALTRLTQLNYKDKSY